jgi:regulator of sirC expression with transglutaminase-like and TPR domain
MDGERVILKNIRFLQKIVLPVVAGSVMALTGAVYAETAFYQPKYHTIAHEILALESEIDGSTPDYEFLDTIIDDVKQHVTIQPRYSQDEAHTILQQITMVLHERHFQEGEAMLLKETCTPKIVDEEEVFIADCDTFSFLYLGIGEALGFPLRLVSLPQHTFIRWHFSDDSYLNWETTAPVSWTDSAYISWYNTTHTPAIPLEQELKSLQRSEIFAIVYYNLGNVLTKKGDYDNAIANYTQALAISPDYANALYQRGNALYLKGDDDSAIANFSRALELNPDDIEALFLRGTVWYMKGDYDNAIGDLSDVLELHPQHAEALYLRGSSWYLSGYYDMALADFSGALELNTELAEVYNDIAWLFATCPVDRYRDGEKAVMFVQKALELQPDSRQYYLDTLAAAYAETGDFQKAVVIQEEAIALLQAEFSPEELFKYMQRLEQYKVKKPWRE